MVVDVLSDERLPALPEAQATPSGPCAGGMR
jgi:hypothetical protein